jgi:hypothetical protein
LRAPYTGMEARVLLKTAWSPIFIAVLLASQGLIFYGYSRNDGGRRDNEGGVRYRTVPYRTAPYRTVPHGTVPYVTGTVPYVTGTVPYRTVRYGTVGPEFVRDINGGDIVHFECIPRLMRLVSVLDWFRFHSICYACNIR